MRTTIVRTRLTSLQFSMLAWYLLERPLPASGPSQPSPWDEGQVIWMGEAPPSEDSAQFGLRKSVDVAQPITNGHLWGFKVSDLTSVRWGGERWEGKYGESIIAMTVHHLCWLHPSWDVVYTGGADEESNLLTALIVAAGNEPFEILSARNRVVARRLERRNEEAARRLSGITEPPREKVHLHELSPGIFSANRDNHPYNHTGPVEDDAHPRRERYFEK